MTKVVNILLGSMLTIIVNNCTNSPSGAIEYSTTVYYLDNKFHKDIPEDFIFKTWGYRIVDPFGREHTYKDRVMIQHGRKETKWCTIHRQHEVVKAYWDKDQYLYYISRDKKSL